MRWARAQGCVVAKLTELNGVPDRIFFARNGPLIVEFKARNERPRTLQEWYLAQLQQAGYQAHYVDNFKDFKCLYDSCQKT